MMTPAGWNTWDVRCLNAVVHLPTCLRARFILVDPRSGQERSEFDWRTGMQRLGPHAPDGSYCQIDLKWDASVVRFEYAAQGDRLVCRISGLEHASHLRLLMALDGAWQREVRATWADGVYRATTGDRMWQASLTGPAEFIGDVPTFALTEPLIVQVSPVTQADSASSAVALARFVDGQRDAALAEGLRTSGWLGSAADGLVRGITWNTIWEPLKGRVCTPVSRDWCKGESFGSYVLFDWDTFFCAVMASLFDPALAQANVRAILQEVDPRGFVPNFGCEFGPSADRSQPPVGAYCTLKLYRMSALADQARARALLEATYPAFRRWHAWWVPNRDGNGDGLLEWGSDPIPGAKDWQCGNMQAAMYESGLDNSPMYDDVSYNAQTHTMEMADVGLNALYAMDALALSEIATLLGRPEEAREYADEYARLQILVNHLLWDEQAGIYKNRHWDGRLSPHLSPTNFYPLIAGIVPQERAERMVREHLLNDHEFAGRYMIPSTARDDPGYGSNDYWRGRIWGPMNFLVSEGLHRYRFDREAHQFARRGLALFLGEWLAESHVHENYNTDTGDGDDVPSSDPVYTWGALLAYIAIQELIDVDPEGGWRFGTVNGEVASVKGVRVAEGMLDVETSPEGLAVFFNGALLLKTDRPALVTRYQRAGNAVDMRLEPAGEGSVALTIGYLAPGAGVSLSMNPLMPGDSGKVADQVLAADANGHVSLHINSPCALRLRW